MEIWPNTEIFCLRPAALALALELGLGLGPHWSLVTGVACGGQYAHTRARHTAHDDTIFLNRS